ncbi:Stage II sporulation protein R (spore_II_R) [Sporomusa ovata DSM 2662]|uniref:Stage II sporulation protein required for processing of pro-sigma-E (SpoIIR) n=1 Tax=Sporomusa ovata TaxID=2378 RepID=A0A0U1KV61_9FIRM|nr:stage II sporulation protein R [Sporomusa ovata]EQB29280.1 stage II sporulation protein R [Sporomusa ovata DSM 2662]CQR71318.1 Stage II sporulation protein required for processing of pro-sigma-E (SpoIIR) [Sporomusa ovata]
MERSLPLWSKRILIILVICFIAGGWNVLFYQQKHGVPVTPNSSDYVRLHILANSDSVQDQQLKLKVRDAVIAYLTPQVKDVSNAQTAKNIIANRQEELILVAKNTLAENGVDYPVAIQIGSFEFPVRSYGSLVLPAGEYQAVRILLGEGAGQNWWCVLFPPLCFIDGTNTTLAPVTSSNEYTQQEDGQKPLKICWKLAEIFN